MRTLVGAALLITLVAASIERNALWFDDGTIWIDSINKSPKKGRAYNELGLHAIQVHDYTLALDAFTRAIRINPYLSNAHINIGLAYEGLERFDMAIAAYEKAIRIDPEEPTAYYNLGIVYFQKKNNPQKALELFLKARDLNPLEPDVHQYLGRIYQSNGDVQLAQKEFQLFTQLK